MLGFSIGWQGAAEDSPEAQWLAGEGRANVANYQRWLGQYFLGFP
jgi:hypothetical protein